MTQSSDDLTPPRPAGWVRRSLPIPLLLVATLAALIHIAPLLNAARETPAGWKLTGFLTGSPDEMQYRMLMQRSLELGPIVDNSLTTEANTPHIPFFFYWGVGQLSQWLDVGPGLAYAYLGCVFAFLLALLLFWIVDHFSTSRYRTWWVYLCLMFGGGFGAHLLLMNSYWRFRRIDIFQRIVTEGLRDSIVFDSYRNHYIFTTLFDTHFLFFLLMALLAIMALYRTLTTFTILRMLLTASMFGLVTLLHIYDGVTLLAICAGVVALFWRRGNLPAGQALATLLVSAVAVGSLIAWQMSLYKSSGLAIPDWRATAIYFSELALAYPLAWGLMAWGLVDYWRNGGLKESFLLGWAGGCIALTLAGPFYPYSDRGALTLQVPIMIIAGTIYFSAHSRVSLRHAIIAVAIFGATPIWKLHKQRQTTSFDHHPSGEPPAYIWMSPSHQRISAALLRDATSRDVLIVDKTNFAYRTDDLWLTIGYPGRLYAGHYGLTPGYDAKRAEVNAFFVEADSADGPAFLRRAGIRFVYVRQDQDVERFSRMPGLVALESTPLGTLFEFQSP
ncbi:MAG: hypothetical protein E4H38_03020 [Gemmatimonadales bacterium]|nr:MAG: hypothetical protein E4H38_03020 [Gemmatimonadales bacterium]